MKEKQQLTNILIITDQYIPGGAGTFMSGLVSQLSKDKNINIHLAIYREENTPFANQIVKSTNVHLHYLYMDDSHRVKTIFRRISLTNKLLSELRPIKFKLVFTDLVFPTVAYIIVRKMYKEFNSCPLIHHIHGCITDEFASQTSNTNLLFSLKNRAKYFLYYFLEKFTLINTSHNFTGSQYSLDQTINRYGQLSISVNKLAVDPLLFQQSANISRKTAKELLNLNPKGKYLLFTSRIEPRKGVTDFFDNLGRYLYLFKDYSFIVCSHFNQSAVLHDFFKKLDNLEIGSKVIIFNNPSRQQIAHIYQAANVTIMPSLELETFGLVTIESFHFGVPVVAFNIGANPELIPVSFLVDINDRKRWPKLYRKVIAVDHNHSLTCPSYTYTWADYTQQLLSIF